MKTLKILSLILITFLSVSCGRDDDEPAPILQPITRDYLVSGKWYLQSGSHVTVSSCGRKSYFQFNSNNTIISQSFEMDGSVCKDYGQLTGTYTLVDDKHLNIIGSSSNTLVEIISINNEVMVFQANSGGEIQTLIFDKTEG